MANYVSLSVGFSRHPKVKRFRALCGIERAEIFLVRLWEWAAEYAPDGDLSGYQPTEIEAELGWNTATQPGHLFSLLTTSGFIDRSEDGSQVVIHNWMLPGRSGYGIAQIEAKRAGYRSRQAKYRRSLSSSNGDVSVSISEGKGKGESVSGDQRSSQSTHPGFDEFWAKYPKRVSKGAAERAWYKLRPPLETCLTTLEWQRKSADWTKDQGKYIPHPATWINGKCWEDSPSPSLVTTPSAKPWTPFAKRLGDDE